MNIYCDGGCWNNGRPDAVSSYGFICLEDEYEESGSGEWGGKNTNNTGELKAMLHAMKYAKGKTKRLRIYSDSQYAINSLSVWSLGPHKANFTLIRECRQAMKDFDSVGFEWVKGHHLSEMNHRADQLATDWLMENANK